MRDAVAQFVKEWTGDNAGLLAAGVSFYAIFSLAPLLALVVELASVAFGPAAPQQLTASSAAFLNARTAESIQRLTRASLRARSTGLTITSAIVLLFTSSAVFAHLRAALDIVLDVPKARERGWLRVVLSRAVAVVMVIAVVLFIGATIAVTSILAVAHQWMPRIPLADVAVWRAIDFAVSTIVVAALFTITLKWVPDVGLPWRFAMRGALTGAVLFSVARFALGLYLAHGSMAQAYGGAASLAVVLVATFVAVVTLFVAAEVAELNARGDSGFAAERHRRRAAEGQQARK